MTRTKKTKRPARRVVLFIVEGPSDSISLQGPLEELYASVDPEVIVEFAYQEDFSSNSRGNAYGGDVTSKFGVTPEKIEYVLNKIVISPFLRNSGYLKSDISEVIQITDLDGAYIPNYLIIQPDHDTDKTLYYDDHIEARDIEGIIERNALKSSNLDYLVSLSSLKVSSKPVPYSIYYFSCNLDHYLHKDANPRISKRDMAMNFSRNCGKDEMFFRKVICDDSCSMHGMSYEDSWEFARKELHSIERHTNLNILVERILDHV